jgi:hypothetical protein
VNAEAKVQTYLFEYRCHGKTFALDVPAYSKAEAEARVAAMNHATFVGTLEGKIPAVVGAWLPRIIVWWKNL